MSFVKITDSAKIKKNFRENFSERLGSEPQSIIGIYIHEKLKSEMEENKKIKKLTDVTINTIYDHISKTLMDENISDEKYSLTESEIEDIRVDIKSEMERVERNTRCTRWFWKQDYQADIRENM